MKRFKIQGPALIGGLTLSSLLFAGIAEARNYKWGHILDPRSVFNGQTVCLGERSSGSGEYDIYHDHLCPSPKPGMVANKGIKLADPLQSKKKSSN